MIKRLGFYVSSSEDENDDGADDVEMDQLSDLNEDDLDNEFELKDVEQILSASANTETTSAVALGRKRVKLHREQEQHKQQLVSIVEKNALHRNDRLRKARYTNKQRTLIFASRGINQRMRHLMQDLRVLVPHSKDEPKFDNKRNVSVIKDICVERSCNNCIFFEARRNTDLYMWFSRCPNGPSMKFYVSSVHTMNELKLTGNCLKGSRPILVFDEKFESMGTAYQCMKELFTQVFGTPLAHPNSKPFIDRTMSFMIVDHKIWVRNYQIVFDKNNEDKHEPVLVEIGPRFVLHPIRIQQGCFLGSTIYQCPHFVNPNAQRRAVKKQSQMKSAMHNKRLYDKLISEEHKKMVDDNVTKMMTENPINDVFEKGVDFE